ncbi:unnamed protein product [Ambrosiozyma monospora]|uniref:Unnamed protein product n=2 Tax=Ambrosiozyma monospora TaxID=43982 RepID=A0ACB5TAT8_AMBMO|nr:unnamed protein product [Ambrosiozyma monospora]
MKNQILLVGAPHTNKLTIANEVFNVSQSSLKCIIDSNNGSHAGLTIEGLPHETKYYTTELGLFIDELEDDSLEKFEIWLNDFKSDDVKELRDFIQGIVFTIDLNASSVEDIDKIAQHLEQLSTQFDDEFIESSNKQDIFQWDGFKIVVGVNKNKTGESPIDDEKLLEIEDTILSTGFEFINYNDTRETNEFGDVFGKERFVDIIENTEWRELDRIFKPMAAKSKEEEEKTRKELATPLIPKDKEESKDSEEDKLKSIENMDVILKKLNIARDAVKDMKSEEQKMEYVDNVLKDMFKYI